MPSEVEDHNFFQIDNFNPNPEKEFLSTEILQSGGLLHMNFFLNLFMYFILNITSISLYCLKYYYVQIGQIIFIFYIFCVFLFM